MLQGGYFLVFSELIMKQKWKFKKSWRYVTFLRSWITLESVRLLRPYCVSQFRYWTGQISNTFVNGQGFGDFVV